MKSTAVFSVCMALSVMLTAAGCGPRKPGLLERNGIRNAGDLSFVIVKSDDVYVIRDKAMLERVYSALNNTGKASGNMYMKRDMVTLVRPNGTTLSFAFDQGNTDLTWEDSSPAFVKLVKADVVGNTRYLSKERVPPFSISQAARLVGPGGRTALPATRLAQIERDVQLFTSAYRPYGSVTQASTWNAISSFLTSKNPGVEVVLKAPIRVQAIVGSTGPEPSHGSTALNLTNLTVDRMLVYIGHGREPWLAFHSAAKGAGWFVTGGFTSKILQGREPEAVYRRMLGN